MRAEGGTPVARQGRSSLTSWCHYGELGLEVVAVEEPSDLEEPVLHEPDEIFDAPLLVAAARRTELGGEAVVEGDLGEGRVPLDLAALPRDHHRFRIVEDSHEGDAPEGGERDKERSDERLHLLVGDELDVDPAGPLQSAREEVQELDGPVIVPDPHVAEVALTELPCDTLEPHEGRGHRGSQTTNQLVDRVLAAGVPPLPEPAEDLDGR
jgi:hypothetical protein